MTDRAEIERLLNQTGRTLKGLPTQDGYIDREDYGDRFDDVMSEMEATGFIHIPAFMIHRSDVIELLVGALRDALDKPKQKRQSVKFVPCVCGYNKHSEWYNCKNHVWFYDCLKCGLNSEKYAAKTKTEAKIGWNKMIEELKAGEVHG